MKRYDSALTNNSRYSKARIHATILRVEAPTFLRQKDGTSRKPLQPKGSENCNMNHIMKRGKYAVYLRKSRADIEKEAYGHFETLAVHEKALRDLMRRDCYPLDESLIFRELVSGESIAERTEFKRMMEGVANKDYAGVIVHAVDRLGRGDILEYGYVLSTFRFTGTLIITPGRVYDPNNDGDYQMLQMMMLFANVEITSFITRQRENKNTISSTGQYLGGSAPFGYDKVKVGRSKTLKPNDDAVVVKLIFELIASGETTCQVANYLNAAGLRTGKGNLFNNDYVWRMIRNETYKGCIRWGVTRNEVVGIEGIEKQKKRVVQLEYDVYPGLHEPIVPEELWEAANDRLGRSPRKHTNYELKNQFAGLIVCAKCGAALRRLFDIKKKSFESMAHPVPSECERQKSTTMRAIVDAMIEALQASIDDLRLELDGGFESHVESEIEAVNRELSKAENRYEKLVELYINDKIDMAVYAKREAALHDQIEALHVRLSELEHEDVGRPERIVASAHEAIRMLSDDSISAADKNAFLKSFISKIEYDNLPLGTRNHDAVKLTVHFL